MVEGAEDATDRGQARIAIDAIAALEPVVAPRLPEEAAAELRSMLASMRMAYANTADAPPSAAPSGDDPPEGDDGRGTCRRQRAAAARRAARPAVDLDAARRGVMAPLATVGVFGGSGFYAFLDDVEEVEVDTPYGPPSDRLFVGDVGGTRVAFLPRHGRNHHLPPHGIPYRANVWAMREIGVERLIGPCAAGSLDRAVPPGSFVVCDQFVDRTHGRADTFYDGPDVRHVAAADPYCPSLRAALVDAGRVAGHRRARRRHDGRDQRPALLDPRGVGLVRRDGVAGRQHDRLPGGLARARARASATPTSR